MPRRCTLTLVVPTHAIVAHAARLRPLTRDGARLSHAELAKLGRQRRRLLATAGGMLSAVALWHVRGNGVEAAPVGLAPRRTQSTGAVFENRIGWAYSARWRKSRPEIVADLRRMRELGCNTVYVGHNAAGDSDPDGYEPGLSPAVWYATWMATPQAENARRIVGVVTTVIDIAREVGLDVVLAIGYQIAMGDEWNARYPDDLRQGSDGAPLIHWESVYTASPYSPQYQRDITRYYTWVNQSFVRPYPHVVAVNLADEPMGTDFSPHAKGAFKARYKQTFDEASDVERGEFLAGVIADYAALSANAWNAINPNVPAMMTLHIERDAPFLPDVERIFSATPDTFIVSADTHLDDGPLERAVTRDSIRLLYGLVRTLGWLSQVYDRPLMLWTSANAWGLKPTGGIADALVNLDIVHDTTKQVGGHLGMLMAWGWNIYTQGIYDDDGNFPVDKETMVADVSRAMVARQSQLSQQTGGRPDRVLYVPSASLYAEIGRRRIDHLAPGIVNLRGIDFVQEKVVYLMDGLALEAARDLDIVVTPQ